MSFSFTIKIPPGANRKKKLEGAKKAAADSDHDIEIKGNTSKGTIEGDVTGSYKVSKNSLIVEITHKPWLATEEFIKETVIDFFS